MIKMFRHTNFFGVSKVAKSWKEAFQVCNVGDEFTKVVAIAGKADEVLNLGEVKVYTYISEEFKGILRGGFVIRKMQFVVKDGIIVDKEGYNIDLKAY